MSLSLKSFAERRKITKEEALEFILKVSKEKDLICPKTAAYLTGYEVVSKTLSDQEVELIKSERLRKHAKAVKYAKKKKLDLPVLDESEVCVNIFELISGVYPRNHKEDFLPQLEGLVLLQETTLINEGDKDLLISLKDLYNLSDDSLSIEFINKKKFDLFFARWANLLKRNAELRNIMTDKEWFVLVLEDKLTLAAAISSGVVYDGVSNEGFHKELFFEILNKH